MSDIIKPEGVSGPSLDPATVKQAPLVTGYQPAGSTILVALLNEAELHGATTIEIAKVEGSKGNSRQAYVIAHGPNLSEGAAPPPGSRILLQGNYVPMPERRGDVRAYGVVEIHNIKARLLEAEGSRPHGCEPAELPAELPVVKSGCCGGSGL